MIDNAIMKEIQELEAIYEKRWGKPVDFIGMPSTMTQESLLLVMRLIIETGESVLVGFEKTKHLINTSIEYNNINTYNKKPAIVKFIGQGENTNFGIFTHGKEYEAFLLEYWQGERKSLHARGDDGQITGFNHFDDFEIMSDEDDVLNSYEAIVECVTHNCNGIKYGKRYKSIGRDKNGMYLVMDESFDCYFYPEEYFKIVEDKNAILTRCSLYCDYF